MKLISHCRPSLAVLAGALLTLALGTAAVPDAHAAPPVVTDFRGVQEDQTIRGTVGIQAIVSGTGITSVTFRLTGPRAITLAENVAPYFFFGDDNGQARGWDTTDYPNGQYTLTAIPVNAAGQGTAKSVRFRVGNTLFFDDFNRANLGSAWVTTTWGIADGAAATAGSSIYDALRSAQGFSATDYVLESRVRGFDSTQGPSPYDEVFLSFGQANLSRNNYYKVSYYASPFGSVNNVYLSRVRELTPGGEFTVDTLDSARLFLSPSVFYTWKVTRNSAGRIQVFIGTDANPATTPVLQANNTAYAALGHFGWTVESEAPGPQLFVDFFRVR